MHLDPKARCALHDEAYAKAKRHLFGPTPIKAAEDLRFAGALLLELARWVEQEARNATNPKLRR